MSIDIRRFAAYTGYMEKDAARGDQAAKLFGNKWTGFTPPHVNLPERGSDPHLIKMLARHLRSVRQGIGPWTSDTAIDAPHLIGGPEYFMKIKVNKPSRTPGPTVNDKIKQTLWKWFTEHPKTSVGVGAGVVGAGSVAGYEANKD